MSGFAFSQLPGGMFDARSVDPSQFPSVPLADYKVAIVSSEPKPNKAETGGYLQLDLRILEGQFAGLIVSDRLNIFHTNQQTVEIAYRRMSAYGHVCGVLQLANSAQIHNIPFIATIGPQTENPQYMKVYKVKDLQGNEPGKAAGNPVAAMPQTPAPAYPQQPQQQQQQQPAAPAAPAGWPAPTNPQAAAPWAPPQPAYAQPQQAPQQAAPVQQQPAAWGAPQQPQQQQAPQQQAAPPWAPQQQQQQPQAPAVPSWPPR